MPVIRSLAAFVFIVLVLMAAACGDGSLEIAHPATTSLRLAAPAGALTVGQQITLGANVLDADGRDVPNRILTWTSTNKNVATVTQAGVVSAVAPGQTTINASVDGKTGMAVVTVTGVAVASIVAGPTALLLEPGQTRQLIATVRDAAGNVLTGRVVTWTSDDLAVATVSATGLVTAIGGGYVTIVAASEGKTFGIAATVIFEDLSPLYR